MENQKTGAQTLETAIRLHGAGELQAAADAYTSLLAKRSNNHDAAYGLGTVRMQLGHADAALPLLEQALRACPDAPEYAFNHAWALAQLGRNSDAAQGFKHAADLATGDIPMLVEICSRLMSLGHNYTAVEILQPAAQRTPASRQLCMALAIALGRVWDFKAAISCYERALALGPGSGTELMDYADLLFLAKQPAAAKKVLVQAQALGVNSPDALYLEARCERIAGNLQKVRHLLREAVSARPHFGIAWELLLESTADDKLDAVVADCLKLADDVSAPQHERAGLLYAVGRAIERLKDYERAFEQFDKANECQRNATTARGLAYDENDVEQFIERMRMEFDVPREHAAPSGVDQQPIFIVGMPRSGTTVVERILGGLEGVSMSGESDALEIVASQFYWAQSHSRGKAARDLASADWDRLAEQYWRLQTVPKSRVTDKMPTNFRHIGLLCAMFPEAPIVYLQRDARDVALSIFSRNFGDAHYYATDPASLAHFLGASQRLMAHWKSVFPGRILDLDYEQLVREPEKQARRLVEFCALQWQPECLNFHKDTGASYTFSEVQVREPLNTEGIGRWRKYAGSLTPFIDSLAANDVQLRDD